MTPAGRVLRPYIMRERGALGGAATSTIVSTLSDLAKPWPLALVVDRIFANHRGAFPLTSSDVSLLIIVAAMTIAIAMADAVAQYMADLLLQRAGERITHSLRDSVYAHLQRLSLRYHMRSQKGDLVTRVTADVNAIGNLFSQSLGSIAQSLLLVVGMFGVVFFIDPVVALAAMVSTPPLAAVSIFFRRRVRVQARQRRKHDGAIASMANEALSAMPVVKAFGTESREHERIRIRSEKRMAIGMQMARTQARFDGTVGTISAIGMAFVLVIGVLRGSAGALTAGELVVLFNYARKAHSPLGSIAKEAARVASAMASAERIAEVLSTDDVVEERPNAHHGEPARGEIALDHVSLRYSPDRPEAIRDVSLTVPAGQRVAIVGTSGAGKTSVGALVARFYDPSEGRVLIDGRDLRDCTLPWLRDQIGVLLQETVLFTGTVEENIAYGSDATSEEVRAAASAAAAASFIEDLPDGYDTQLGPQGVGLSGGQRQRLGIARTLLRNPPVLVLDEPTTGLDAQSQDRVMEGLSALMRGRTTLMITHELELALHADHVIVMEKGRVARQGPPREVLGDAVASPPAPTAAREPQPQAGDRRLPQLPAMLDLDTARAALTRSLGDEVDDVHVARVVYRPGKRALVHYRVQSGGEQLDAVATAKSRPFADEDLERARSASELAGAPAPTNDPELGALVTWLPFDPALPVLAHSADDLTRRLADAGVRIEGDPGEPALVGYKPGSRAVLRFDGHLLKAYGRRAGYEASVAGLQGAPRTRVATPQLAAALPDLRMTVQRRIDDAQIASPFEDAVEAGRVLRELQRSPFASLRVYGPERCVTTAARTAEIVAALMPDLGARLATLQRRLLARMPAPSRLVPAHGDFCADNLLRRGDELVVVDFDGLCVAEPSLDLATYAADVVQGTPDDLPQIMAALDPLLEGYGERPESLEWYLAADLMARAAYPFQRQLGDWPNRVEAIVSSAEEVLH